MRHIPALIRQARAHEGFVRYTRNTGWLFAARFLTLGTSFLATLFIARSLGPENYGQLSYALSFIALFSFVASLGMDTILYRDLIREPQKRERILGTALALRLASGVVAAVAAATVGMLLSDDVSALLIAMLSGTFVLSAFQLIQFEFQARAQAKYPSLVTMCIAIFLSALKVCVVWLGGGVLYLAAVLLLEPVLYALAYLYLYSTRSGASFLHWRYDAAYARSLLIDSLPLIALSAFTIIYARIDQVFIKHLLDAHAVGVYDAAVRVAELWFFVPGLLLASLFPAIVNAKTTSDALFTKRLRLLILLLGSIAVAVAVAVSLMAPLIIRILYGAAFMDGVPVLQIYVWSFVGASLGFLANHYLVAENYRRILSLVALVPMATNIALNLLWIPAHGIHGAAYATLVSYSIMPFMLLCFAPTRARLARLVGLSAAAPHERAP